MTRVKNTDLTFLIKVDTKTLNSKLLEIYNSNFSDVSNISNISNVSRMSPSSVKLKNNFFNRGDKGDKEDKLDKSESNKNKTSFFNSFFTGRGERGDRNESMERIEYDKEEEKYEKKEENKMTDRIDRIDKEKREDLNCNNSYKFDKMEMDNLSNLSNLNSLSNLVNVTNINDIFLRNNNSNTNLNSAKKSEVDNTENFKKNNYREDEDEIKNIITMQDFYSGNIIPDKTDINCFWCRHGFDNRPISCPINYKNNQLEKKYYSEITKDKYIIKENIDNEKYAYFSNKIDLDKSDNDKNESINVKNKGIKLVEKNYYISDGIFCSFNCCLAFINENKNNNFYNNSKSLLLNIYSNLGGCVEKLIPAPSWRILKKYGGSMEIEEFRNTFNTSTFVEINTISEFLKFKTLGFYYTSNIGNIVNGNNSCLNTLSYMM